MDPAIFTIGYEGLVQSQLLDLLTAAKVHMVLDVRAIASSRKAGFSKNILRASLSAVSVHYAHDTRLGTTKPGRQAVRAGKIAEMVAIFGQHMATPPAQAGLQECVAMAREKPICLLCFERDPHSCHRTVLAGLIRRQTGQAIRHL